MVPVFPIISFAAILLFGHMDSRKGGSFALADIVIVKMFGVGLGLAILIDATLVRALMVPAIMRVIGDLNRWCPNLNPRKLWAKLS